MSERQLPEFQLGRDAAPAVVTTSELSECHGVACGLLVADVNTTLVDYLRTLEAMQIEAPTGRWRDLLTELLDVSKDHLASEHFGFHLWLPDSDCPMAERGGALSAWCNGFLAGVAEAGRPRLDTLSEMAREGLADLQQVTRLDTEAVLDEEAQEADYAEVVEFVRVAVLLIREELRASAAPAAGDSLH